MSWHAPPELLEAWVAGHAPEHQAAAAEAHLVSCAECRSRVAAVPQPTDLHAVWTRVADDVEAAPPNFLTRVARACGVSESDTLVLRAAPAFTWAWSVSVAVVVALSMAAAMSNPDRMLGFYLLFAPLVPMAGVAAGYGPAADPTYELAVAAPYSKPRILLLRGVTVLVGSIPVTCAIGMLLDPWWVAVAWLAPGLTALLVMLAALSWVGPVRAASGVAGVWTAAVVLAMLRHDQLALVGHAAMVVFAASSLVALAVTVTRSRLLDVAPEVGGW